MDTLNKPAQFGIMKDEEQTVINLIYEFFIKDRNFQRDPSMVGKPIRACDASEKYGVSQANLTRWADAGMIRVLNRGKKLLELDEADVAMVTGIFKEARKHTTPRRAAWVLKTALAQ